MPYESALHTAAEPVEFLSREQWGQRQQQHQQEVDELTAAHLKRRSRGEKHPIMDFLFDYYPVKPGKLRTWHPGIGVVVQDAAEFLQRRDYMAVDAPQTAGSNPAVVCATVNVQGFVQRRGDSLRFIRHLLSRTATNPAHFDCFGLHEWAMVYRTTTPRHDLPLRLGPAGTNEVVDSHVLRCTHYDAFRFFTPAARPLNARELSRDDQPRCDQRGCLHATMDLYKWATKLGPLVPGEVWLETFRLARDVRQLDMAASPYDCSEYGLEPVCIETAEGKAEYVARQRQFALRAEPLREKLIRIIDAAVIDAAA